MSEEVEKKEPTAPEKLLIDDPSDFQFHAAYLAYSEIFDKITNSETRKLLNDNITALKQKQIDVRTFYANISQYRRVEGGPHQYGRSMIKVQRKKDWRRKTQKHERIERHRR